LAIIDETGDVALIDRDGANRVEVTNDAGLSSTYFQPTWAPDARRLAFSRAATDMSVVVIYDVEAATDQRIESPNPAFYFSWSRESERVAYLGNAADGAGLQLTVVDTDAAVIRSDIGQPYYFAWGDEGAMVVHVGTDRIDIVDPEGASGDGDLATPGSFRTPDWIDQGVLYVERGSDAGRLVLVPDRGDPRLIAQIPGGASFTASPDGDRIAIQSIGAESGGDFATNATLVLAGVGAQDASLLPANRIVVLDLETLEWTRVGNDPALAFWWSPDGEQLLVLGVPDPARPRLAWQIWSEEAGLSEPLVFTPGPELLRDVVPFFDQYAQSVSLWAPDATAFAFAGFVDGESGIWVASLGEAGITATRVAGGAWVAWSPR
jgi:TolB protein